jgi:uncharacterized protein (TIGR02678 family)
VTVPAVSSTAAHDAAARQEAGRALLHNPQLTARSHPDELALVRRHARELKGLFATVLGYPLVVEASFARLMKAPLSDDGPARAAKRASGREFSPRTYAYLALVCAGLLAPDTGEQVLMSALVEQLRSDAAIASLAVDDTLAERRNLVAAIDLLVEWGVLEETDGTVAGWSERKEEALLSVNRALLPHLLARPLHDAETPAQLMAADPEAGEQPRRSLRRKLVENPLVRREDLTTAERDALSRERTEISRVLEESFGLMLEVRAEGALCFDRDGELSDVAFPGTGTVRQAALLLLSELIARSGPHAGTTATIAGRDVPGLACTWRDVDNIMAELAGRYGRAWSAEYVADLDHLREEVVSLLHAFGLADITDDALVVHPAAARYRADPQRAPAKTRARDRLDDSAPTIGNPSLFDSEISS